MVTLLEEYKNLLKNKKDMFWGYLFGFVDYNTIFEQLFNTQQKQVFENGDFKEDSQKPKIKSFINSLEYYRSQRNSKSFPLLDFEQTLHLSKNSFKDQILSLCVLLNRKDISPVSLDISNQLDTRNLKQIQADSLKSKERDKEQFSNIEHLYDLDAPFFHFLQGTYSFICQSTYNCFKNYIKKRAYDLIDKDDAFSAKNLSMFLVYGNVENSKVLKFATPYKNEQLISDLWQKEMQNVGFINLYDYNFLYVFDKLFYRLENEMLEKELELPLHVTVGLKTFPLAQLFWNSSSTYAWNYSFKVHDFRSTGRTYVYPVEQLEQYYEPNFDL